MHEIVVSLSSLSLGQKLVDYPEQINIIIALRRTRLVCVAARGDAHNVALLLGAGGSPDALEIRCITAF